MEKKQIIVILLIITIVFSVATIIVSLGLKASFLPFDISSQTQNKYYNYNTINNPDTSDDSGGGRIEFDIGGGG